MSLPSGNGGGLTFPAYAGAVYPSALAASTFALPGKMTSQPGPGQAGGPPGMNVQHRNKGWASEVPVDGQVKVVPSERYYTRYLEAKEQIFSIDTLTPSTADRRVREAAVFAFNIYTVNQWLKDRCVETNKWLVDNGASGVYADLLTRPESAWNERIFSSRVITDASTGKQQPETDQQTLNRLYYATGAGIAHVVHYLGSNNTQSNDLRAADISRGSISAEAGNTMVVFGVRGPHEMRNIWGPQALPGKHLWLLLRRVRAPGTSGGNEHQANATTGSNVHLSATDFFQVTPYVRVDWDGTIEPSQQFYTGLTGYRERTVAFYVGRCLMNGRRTVLDDTFRESACGLTSGISMDECHHRTQMLEVITVAVQPQAFGSLVRFA